MHFILVFALLATVTLAGTPPIVVLENSLSTKLTLLEHSFRYGCFTDDPLPEVVGSGETASFKIDCSFAAEFEVNAQFHFRTDDGKLLTVIVEKYDFFNVTSQGISVAVKSVFTDNGPQIEFEFTNGKPSSKMMSLDFTPIPNDSTWLSLQNNFPFPLSLKDYSAHNFDTTNPSKVIEPKKATRTHLTQTAYPADFMANYVTDSDNYYVSAGVDSSSQDDFSVLCYIGGKTQSNVVRNHNGDVNIQVSF
ncbi:hypothetical protein P9112_014073 [Eukaryota sp. TZLM1-RC]